MLLNRLIPLLPIADFVPSVSGTPLGVAMSIEARSLFEPVQFPPISFEEIGGNWTILSARRGSIDMVTPKGVPDTHGAGAATAASVSLGTQATPASPSPLNGERAGVRGETVRETRHSFQS